jgi:hypothetical protein
LDSAVGGIIQLYKPTGDQLVGCREKSSTDCPWQYSVYFQHDTEVMFCQPGIAAGKDCSSLYAVLYSTADVNSNGDVEGCAAPAACNPRPVSALQFYEVVGGTPTLVGCGPKVPNSCDIKYPGNYIPLRDGGNTTGGALIGCLKLDDSGGAPGSNQACPAGFGFSWYTSLPPSSTTGNQHSPVLKESWLSNGGNAKR